MGKKKSNLSKEEALAQALVPESEWPYQVPGNWVWVRLGEITNIKTGSEDANFATENGKHMFFTCAAEPLLCDSPAFSGESILIAGNGMFHVSYYNGEFNAYQRTYVLQNFKSIIGKFLYFHIKNSIDNITKNNRGSTIQYIRLGDITNNPVPVPPIAEQQRIVDRIESLFEKLDQAKRLIQEALDSFENRRAAILHKAFSGELTKKWREENGVGMESWDEVNLGDVCRSFQYGTSKKSESAGKVIVLRMGNLQNGEIDWSNLAFSNDDEDIKKYKLIPGDVLFNRTNSPELVGKTSVYRGDAPAIFAGYLIRINYNECIDGFYLNYFMNSGTTKEFCNQVKSDGVNQSNINASKLSKHKISICSIEEQREIVKILDGIFEQENNAFRLFDLIEQIETLKKSILARAFRGDLGTNIPTEGSVMDLFREILS